LTTKADSKILKIICDQNVNNWGSAFRLPPVELFVAVGFILAGPRAQILSHVISIFETAE